MPPAKKSSSSSSSDTAVNTDQPLLEQANEQGFLGDKVDPLPNEAHSLESGPDAPTAAEQRAALAEADVNASSSSSSEDGGA